jgi:hypothetical protein
VFAELARAYPLPRTSPNATPVSDILKAFSLNCLLGGTRFAHCRRLQDDGAVATITGMHKGRVCGEDAFRRLCGKLDARQVEEWFAPAEQMIHQAIPPNAVADWDSTVIVRYGKQEDAAIGSGQEPIMAWHEQGKGKRPSFLFKLKLTANVKKAIAAVPWNHWQAQSKEGLVQLVELKLKLHGWSARSSHSIRARKAASGGNCKEDFSA